MAKAKLTIALAGNPNCGKTTIFNAITGARQHVGNYPGVTVERKEGYCDYEDHEITVVDLPGTYSLTAHSLDELVARHFIVEERPDVVVDIVDSSNLERNLYLATQLIELGVPLVLAFNMSDMAESRGFKFDYEQLSKLLAAPIVPTVGHRGKGIEELLGAVAQVATSERRRHEHMVHYGREVEAEIAKLHGFLAGESVLNDYPPRWLAVKLLENDEEVREKVGESGPGAKEIIAQAEASIEHLHKIYEDLPEVVIAEARYGFISGACEETVKSTVETRHDMSDRIDKVLCHRFFGMFIFLAMMFLVFQLTFTVGQWPMDWTQAFFAWLGRAVSGILPAGYLRSLLVDGIIGGVGGVLVFLPNILFLFLAIAFLEDSGYMARAAFIMDRIMHKIGLHGKSFIPLLIGFGCNIPAVMATRTLENRRDRLVTILVAPLMSCTARYAVYVLLAGAFFSRSKGAVVFSLYVLGMAMAIVMAKLFRKYLLPGPSTPFVMELPPYRLPTARGLLVHMWERGWLYVKKAGTIILAISVIMWVLSTFPRYGDPDGAYGGRIAAAETGLQTAGKALQEAMAAEGVEPLGTADDTMEAAAALPESVRTAMSVQNEAAAELGKCRNELAQKELAYSSAGRIGLAIVPVIRPLGLDNWKLGTALFAGFGAKEVVVSTLGTLYSLGEVGEESEPLRQALREDMTPLQAYTLMVFVLLYVPCMAAIIVIKRETNSWRWPLFTIVYTTALAWVASFLVYQGGCLLGLG